MKVIYLDKVDTNPYTLDRVEANTVAVPPVRMSGIWRTIRGYILWSYERGTIQYDVMVTLILLFVFLSPYWVNFKDKPVEHNPHRTGVVVTTDGKGGFIYQIEATAIQGKGQDEVRSQLFSIIEPIAGEVTISSYEAIHDPSGKVSAYKVWVQK